MEQKQIEWDGERNGLIDRYKTLETKYNLIIDFERDKVVYYCETASELNRRIWKQTEKDCKKSLMVRRRTRSGHLPTRIEKKCRRLIN